MAATRNPGPVGHTPARRPPIARRDAAGGIAGSKWPVPDESFPWGNLGGDGGTDRADGGKKAEVRTLSGKDAEPHAGQKRLRGRRRAGEPEVLLFTDGACRGNPGPGGWAYVLKHPRSGTVQYGYGSAPRTTNNQMELLAVIHGLEALRRKSRVHVVTDSEYVAKGCRLWLPVWKQQGWRRRQGRSFKPVRNEELWRRLDELLQRHDVTFEVVRGHSGHPENELCDRLAVQAADSQTPATVERFAPTQSPVSDAAGTGRSEG
ncbi:MAG: ribonuclease HI [Planctomycetota bacterium]|nr:MAG: ribonuclease HI [Planctomycetota bacterium]